MERKHTWFLCFVLTDNEYENMNLHITSITQQFWFSLVQAKESSSTRFQKLSNVPA